MRPTRISNLINLLTLSRLISRQSSGGNVSLDPMVSTAAAAAADDSILLDLVESLQGDFPDCIAFDDDDPFELYGAAAATAMTMQ